MQNKNLWMMAGVAAIAVILVVGVVFIVNSLTSSSTETVVDPNSTSPNVDTTSTNTDDQASNDPINNPNTEIDPNKVIATANGRELSPDMLFQTYASLIDAYRDIYAQDGRDLDQVLEGAEGSYYQLQLQYQALQQLVQRSLATQELEKLGFKVEQANLNQEAQTQYETWLAEYTMTEAELVDLLSKPDQRALTQTLLGISENTVDEIKQRYLEQVEQNMLSELLYAHVLGDISPTSETGQRMVEDWLSGLRTNSEIVIYIPLLNAYHLETMVETGTTLEQRRELLDTAIAAYETIKENSDNPDPYVDYYLSRLYNLSVNWGLALERDLITRAEETQDDGALEALKLEILRNRTLASQSVTAYDAQTREQIEILLQADPGNPYYYYLYADFLFENWEEFGITQSIRQLWSALQMDPDYVDAYVLMGDANRVREFFEESLQNYNDARSAMERIKGTESGFKMQNTTVELLDLKTSEAALARVKQLTTLQEPPEDADAQRQSALSTAETLLNELISRLAPDDELLPLTLTSLGDLAVIHEDYVAAQLRFNESLALIEDKETRVKLGEALFLNDQLEEARAEYETVLENDEGFAEAWLGLAQVQRAQDDLEGASHSYQQAFSFGFNMTYTQRRQIALEALEWDEGNIEMRLALAQFYFERNVFAGAEKQYNYLLEKNTHTVTGYLGLGQVALARLQFTNSMGFFNQALEHDPNLKQQIEIYEQMYQAERSLAGPGNAVSETGQDMLVKLSSLYLDSGQLSNSWQRLQVLKTRYPNFRPDAVSNIEDQLAEIVGDNLPGRPVPDQGHAIIAPGTTHADYNSVPPTSGWHYTVPADWGAHATPIQNEIQLRNLAAGGVIVQYDPNIDETLRESLATMQREFRQIFSFCKLILAPYEGLSTPIVVTAWNRILQLEEYDRTQIQVFVDTFIDQGPEAGEVGCSLN
jgi:hypothetical protein